MNCRSCDSPTHEVFSLGRMPLANSLLSSRDEDYPTYPLDLLLCESCTLVQLAETVPPDELFVDYNYLTSCSPPMVDHAKQLVSKVRESRDLSNRSLIVEIGSNDGYLLQHYDPLPVLGIDPSDRAADAAMSKDVPTIRGFFTSAMARELGPQADIIHANNVLAHVPDLNDFVEGLSLLLKPDGMIIVEVPYLARLIDKTAFDTLYHEHVYYFSVTALALLFNRHRLKLNDVEEIPIHGGSLRLFISHSGVRGVNVSKLIVEESATLRKPAYFLDFARRVEACRKDTPSLLSKGAVGFGAAAKATIFLNACGIKYPQLLYVVDDTPSKIGKFIPGTGLKIVSSAEWLTGIQPPDTMILAWNFAQEIAHRYRTDYRGEFFTWYSRGVGATV